MHFTRTQKSAYKSAYFQGRLFATFILRFINLLKVQSIFNEESVGWNLNKRMRVSL